MESLPQFKYKAEGNAHIVLTVQNVSIFYLNLLLKIRILFGEFRSGTRKIHAEQLNFSQYCPHSSQRDI
jgi:hypothetical protein